jgi:hypothetical protein
VPYIDGKRVTLEEWNARWHPTDNAPFPQAREEQEPEAGQRRTRVTPDKVRAAIAEATGVDVGPVQPRDEDEHYLSGGKPGGERVAQAEKFAAMPHHKADRPSQRPGARRTRYLKQIARDEGISVAEAARQHPERARKNLKVAS